MDLNINQRVNVLWIETGCFFTGVIIKINKDGYDVVYDEMVRGKQCIEKNIPPSRISLCVVVIT